jgi:peptidoglycan/xylan/chitin deacetylase (PgdA/CDA1 family)
MNKVINFHDVRDKNWLEEVLVFLKRKYRIIPVSDLESFFYSRQESKNSCHITVDDGDKTFYDIMYPLLKKYNLPATLFVSPRICSEQGNFWFQEILNFNENEIKKVIADYLQIDYRLLGEYYVLHICKNLRLNQIQDIINTYKRQFGTDAQESRNLNINQLLEISSDSLVQIGAHTQNHPILANEEDWSSRNEIIDSFNGLKDILGYEVKYFAFPNGIPSYDFGERELDTLKSTGCRLAFSTLHKDFEQGDNPLMIPRYYVSHGNINFIRFKMSFGKYWNAVRSLKVKSEEQARTELRKLLLSEVN